MRLKRPFSQVRNFMHFAFCWLPSPPTLKLLFSQGAPFSHGLCNIFFLLLPHLCFLILSVSRKIKGGKPLKGRDKYKNQEEGVAYFFPSQLNTVWEKKKKNPNTFSFKILKRKKKPLLFNQL